MQLIELGRFVGGNIPGLNRLRLIDVDDVVGVYPPERMVSGAVGNCLPVGGLQVKAGANFIRIWFAAGSGDFVETLVDGVHGKLWKTEIILPVSGDAGYIGRAVEMLENRRFLAITVDNSSVARLVGTMKQPLAFGSVMKLSGSRGHEFRFSVETKRQAYYLPGWTDAQLYGVDAAFGYDFDFGFMA